MRKLVIIPTYNEKENISAMISKVFSLPEPFDMLVIDDGSPDGTAAIVRERQREFPDRSVKKGVLPISISCHVGPGTLGIGLVERTYP